MNQRRLLLLWLRQTSSLVVGFLLGVLALSPGKDSMVVNLTAAHIRCLGLESNEEHGWQREHKADQRGVPLDAPGVKYKRRLSAECFDVRDDRRRFQVYEGWWRRAS